MGMWHENGNDGEIFTFSGISAYVLTFNLLHFVLNKNMMPLQKRKKKKSRIMGKKENITQ